MQEAETIKRYCGVVRGSLAPVKGVWARALSNRAEGRRYPQGARESRVAAATEYSVAASGGGFSAVEFRLRSGRTHQIRRHAALAGHSIVGDARYGKLTPGFGGIALHAWRLTVRLDGKTRSFETPAPAAWAALAPLLVVPPPSWLPVCHEARGVQEDRL